MIDQERQYSLNRLNKIVTPLTDKVNIIPLKKPNQGVAAQLSHAERHPRIDKIGRMNNEPVA